MPDLHMVDLPPDLPGIPAARRLLTADHEVRFLCWLAQRVPGDILEVGCNYGATTIALARTNPSKTVWGVDRQTTRGLLPPQVFEVPERARAGELARDAPNVRIILTKTGICDLILPTNLGMVFIDGDHSYPGVKSDTEALFLHGFQGLMVWHDYNHDPEKVRDWIGVKRYVDGLKLERLYALWNSTVAFAWIGPDSPLERILNA